MRKRGSAQESGLGAATIKQALWLAAALAIGVSGPPAAVAAEKGVAVAVAMASPVPAAAQSPLFARVDLSDQTMNVYVADKLQYTFPVSTGRGSYRTPTGSWRAQWLSRYHRSRKYHNAPMPWSVFFYKGYAVHGTTEVTQLGQPASHGCVRLHPDNAKIFYELVQNYGKANTLIRVVQ